MMLMIQCKENNILGESCQLSSPLTQPKTNYFILLWKIIKSQIYDFNQFLPDTYLSFKIYKKELMTEFVKISRIMIIWSHCKKLMISGITSGATKLWYA